MLRDVLRNQIFIFGCPSLFLHWSKYSKGSSSSPCLSHYGAQFENLWTLAYENRLNLSHFHPLILIWQLQQFPLTCHQSHFWFHFRWQIPYYDLNMQLLRPYQQLWLIQGYDIWRNYHNYKILGSRYHMQDCVISDISQLGICITSSLQQLFPCSFLHETSSIHETTVTDNNSWIIG